MSSILVVGSVAFDSIRTPFGETATTQGGSAVYFALAASRFAAVKLVAVVGEDFSDEHMKVFAGRPIDLEGLVRKPGETFRWSGEYRFDMNEAVTLKTELNVFEAFDPAVPPAHRETPFLFLANIAWSHFLGRGIVDEVDDVRISNPPSNEPLLAELAKKYVEYKYDFRRLVRDICTSATPR